MSEQGDGPKQERILWVDDYHEPKDDESSNKRKKTGNNEVEIRHFELYSRGRIKVIKARSTDTALEKYDEGGPFHLIISDVGREEGENGEDNPNAGFELLNQIREREKGKEELTPFIFYTSTYQKSRRGHLTGDDVKMVTEPKELYDFVANHTSFEYDPGNELKVSYEYLYSLDSPQERGKEFEQFLTRLFAVAGLTPQSPFRPYGEEIDGSIVVNGQTFLYEAKWRKEKLPASALYAFKGKVDGKLDGTIGIVISMSGYSERAVDALTTGKSLNLILFDKKDIELCVNKGAYTFEKILLQKIRRIAEKGDVYADVFNEVAQSIPPQLRVVCETREDEHILEAFAKRILESEKTRQALSDSDTPPEEVSIHLYDDDGALSGDMQRHIVQFEVAGGKMNIPATVNRLNPTFPLEVIVVADVDGNDESARDYIAGNTGIFGRTGAERSRPDKESETGDPSEARQHDGGGTEELPRRKETHILLVAPELETWLLPVLGAPSNVDSPRIFVSKRYENWSESRKRNSSFQKWLEECFQEAGALPDDAPFRLFESHLIEAATRENEIRSRAAK